MWLWHYWPTLDYNDPLFTEELTTEEMLRRCQMYEEGGWKVGFKYTAAIQYEKKPEVSLFTTSDLDWLTSPFYRDQTIQRLGAEIRVEAKRAERLRNGVE